MSAVPTACFDKFAPDGRAFSRMKLSRYAGTVIEGERTWCHTVNLAGGEVGHVYHAAGTRIGSSDLGAVTLVFRMGGIRIGATDDSPGPAFNEVAVYPDGCVEESRYIDAAHEFVLVGHSTHPKLVAGAYALTPRMIEKIWRLILRLRETGDASACQNAFDEVLACAIDGARMPVARPVAHALRYLGSHWGSGRASADVAATAGVSTAYLCRLFKDAFGTSIGRYQRLLRVSRAAGLLWGTSMPIDDVAIACGFSDQSHLTKQMLESFALTPSVFRRMAPCIGNAKLAHIERLSDPTALAFTSRC